MPKKMKVIMLGWEYPPEIEGGLGVHTHGLANSLAKQGAGVTLVLPGFCKAKGKKGLDIEFVRPIKKGGSHARFLVSVRRYNERICRMAPRIIRKKGISLVHAHDWITFASALRLKETTGIRFIATFHSTEYDRNEHAGRDSTPAILEREAARRADGLIAVSKMVKETLAKRYGASRKKIAVIPNGPSMDRFPKAKNRGTVLFAGRLARQKGPEYLLGAIPKIRQGPKFIMCGDGPLRRPLEGYAAALGVSRRVKFTGFLPKKKLCRLYSECSVFASPSVREPFGIALLDAMAAGKPCVATRETGLLEYLPKGCCIAVGCKNPSKLAEAIEKLLASEGLRQAMGRRAKEASRRFTWENTAALTLDAYLKATGRSPRSR